MAVSLRAARLFVRSLASGHGPLKNMVAMLDTRGPSSIERTEPLVEMGAFYPPGYPSPSECIDSIPVIPVEGHLAICDGGGGALGHPIEYIQLNTRHHDAATCKYCGLRFISTGGGHH
mmetsp:Transcript_24312/g.57615  ORF Transcript_24312/g.57615 Transcript_24312/m.57615 type:complete len:118 (-) Transcript_24312:129-482(-)